MAIFSLKLHMAKGTKELSGVSFTRARIPFIWALPLSQMCHNRVIKNATFLVCVLCRESGFLSVKSFTESKVISSVPFVGSLHFTSFSLYRLKAQASLSYGSFYVVSAWASGTGVSKLSYKGLDSKWASQVALVVKNLHAIARDFKRCRFDLWIEKIPRRRARQPTPAFLSGEFQGQRSLAGCGS